MDHNQDELGLKEYISIAILAIGTKLTDDTSALFYKGLSNAAWLAPLINGILSIIPIYFLLKVLTLYDDKNLLDVIQHLFGKTLACIFIFFLFIHGSSAVIIDSAIYTNIIGTMYFNKTPTIVLYAILLGICVYGAKKGLAKIGSVAWTVLLYIKIPLFLAFF